MTTIKFPKFKDYTDQKVNFMQPKMDGHLAKIKKSSGGGIEALTKNDKDITLKLLEIDHIEQELIGLSCDSQIFAELHCPGVDATSVPTMLNEANEKLDLTIFAAPLLGGKDISNKNLILVMEQLNLLGINVSFAIPIKHDFINDTAKNVLLEQSKQKGLEGWVLKEAHMKNWYKLKPVRTLDAVVVETFISTSESYWGLLKAVRVIVYKPDGTEFNLGNVGIGLKAVKEEFNTDAKRKTLIGRVCVINYDKIGAKGGMRFPRMAKDSNDNIIWRTDKDPKQCTTEQLECNTIL